MSLEVSCAMTYFHVTCHDDVSVSVLCVMNDACQCECHM